jgi:hypothetical protein
VLTRFETMPSRPIAQARRNSDAPLNMAGEPERVVAAQQALQALAALVEGQSAEVLAVEVPPYTWTWA